MSSWNPATHDRDAIQAATTVPADRVHDVAEQAHQDAISIVVDVRDTDPRIAWGRLVRWGREEPTRLIACSIAMAAMVDPDRKVSQLLKWTEGLTATDGRGAA